MCYNAEQAQRLIGMAEALTVIEDSALRAELQTAITTQAELLRSRQRDEGIDSAGKATGGWAWYQSRYGSDPLTTAMVGLALDYTEPSASDPVVRKAIRYLLSTQSGNGAWFNRGNGFRKHLAATSFVMAYLPRALVRLGGIDTDLHLSFANNVSADNFNIAPDQSTPTDTDGIHHLWHLQSVTGDGQQLNFDLLLQNMRFGEIRPTSVEAWLEFDNDFTDEIVRLDIAIPSVRTTLALTTNATLDKTTYIANETVQITALVINAATVNSPDFKLQYTIYDAQDNIVATLPEQNGSALSSESSAELTTHWNTGTTLIGDYHIKATLLDLQGNPIATARSADFRILAASTDKLELNSRTDKPNYHNTDIVNIDHQLFNLNPNVLLEDVRLKTDITAPDGSAVYTDTQNIGQLAPGAQHQAQSRHPFTNAAEGNYSVRVRAYAGDTLLQTQTNSYNITLAPELALSGNVSVEQAELPIGNLQTCQDTLNNTSSFALNALQLQHLLVKLDSGDIITTTPYAANLQGNNQQNTEHKHTTDTLEQGDYACILQMQTNNQWQTLNHAYFRINPAPEPQCTQETPLDVIYLIDLSESMEWGFISGGSKFAAAQRAASELNSLLSLRNDGSRAALVTFSGAGNIEDNLNHAANIQSDFSSDFTMLGQQLTNLAPDQGATAIALGLNKVNQLLTQSHNPDHRPVLVWLSDGLPNIDAQGRGPDAYPTEQLEQLRLYDQNAQFLTPQTIAQLGQCHDNLCAGQALADAMTAITQLKQDLPDLRIYTLALHGDGSRDGSFSVDLLSFAADHTQGGLFNPGQTDTLSYFIQNLYFHSTCGVAPISNLKLNLDAADQSYPNTTLGVQAHITNTGPFSSHDIQLQLQLPDGMQHSQHSNLGYCDNSGHCLLPHLAPGLSLPLHLQTQTSQPADYRLTAQVNSASIDPLVDDNQASHTLTIHPMPSYCLSDSFSNDLNNWQTALLGNARSNPIHLNNGHLNISGNGENLLTNDHIHYLYQTAPTGDFRTEISLTAMPELAGDPSHRKTAFILRDGITAQNGRDRRLMIAYTPADQHTGSLTFAYRPDTNGDGYHRLSADIPNLTLPLRLAIEKRGDQYTALYSDTQGTTWQNAGTLQLDLKNTLTIGMGNASYAQAPLTSQYDDFGTCPAINDPEINALIQTINILPTMQDNPLSLTYDYAQLNLIQGTTHYSLDIINRQASTDSRRHPSQPRRQLYPHRRGITNHRQTPNAMNNKKAQSG